MRIRRISFLLFVIALSFFVQQVGVADDVRSGWLWPVPYDNSVVTQLYHGSVPGIDIGVRNSSQPVPIRASKGGTVIAVYTGCTNYCGLSTGDCVSKGRCDPHGTEFSLAWNEDYRYCDGFCNLGLGNGVIISHDGGAYSSYAHMQSVSVSVGDVVRQGDQIGILGATGRADGPHVHFTIADRAVGNPRLNNIHSINNEPIEYNSNGISYIHELVVSGAEMTNGGSQIVPDGNYLIASAGTTDKTKFNYLDINGVASPAQNGTDVGLVTGKAYEEIPDYDVWTLTFLNNGYYKITQKGTNVALNVADASINSGANVNVQTYNGNKNQQWAITHNGSNGYRIQARNSGFSIDISGENIQQSVGNSSNAQAWLFIPWHPAQPVAEGAYIIESALQSGLHLNFTGNSSEIASRGASARLWDQTGYPGNNIFELSKLDSGYYTIQYAPNSTPLCLNVVNGSSALATDVTLGAANQTPAQKWALIPRGSGYQLVSMCNGYALDSDGNENTANDTNVRSDKRHFPTETHINQVWKFVSVDVHTIHYDANNGTGAPADQKKYSAQDLTLSTVVPTRQGYDFLGWALYPDATYATINPGDKYTQDEDRTLYAVWEWIRPGIQVSCTLNGQPVHPETVIGVFSIEIVSDGVHEYDSVLPRYSKDLIEGSSYRIYNVRAMQDYEFDEATSSPLSGTVGSGKTRVFLNFIPQRPRVLQVQLLLDGEPVESLDGIGTFDVTIYQDDELIDILDCVSFSDQFDEDCSYEIGNIETVLPYRFDGVAGGDLTGDLTGGTVTVTLAFSSVFVPEDNWQEMDTLPANIDLSICEVEYRNHYVTTGRTSPGEDWLLQSEGPVQYENDGGTYESATPLTTSETVVQVGHYYYHWCGHPESNTYSNWYRVPGKYEIYDEIPSDHVQYFVIRSTNIDSDGNRLYYELNNLDGTQATCPHGAKYYYEQYVYQNRKPYRINTYVRYSDWVKEPDPDASYVTYRVRRISDCTITFDNRGGMFDIETLQGYTGMPIDLPAYSPDRPGYWFFKWTLDEDGAEGGWLPGGQINADRDVTLYAQWKPFVQLILPENLLEIGEEAFNSINAQYIRIPDNCSTIGRKAFANIGSLQQVYIPATTKHIESDAFEGSGVIGHYVIFGYSGSEAESFAEQKGMRFVTVGTVADSQEN